MIYISTISRIYDNFYNAHTALNGIRKIYIEKTLFLLKTKTDHLGTFHFEQLPSGRFFDSVSLFARIHHPFTNYLLFKTPTA